MIIRLIAIAVMIYAFTPRPILAVEDARPKIGLVLGGGGALGFAHVGVLKVLEEQRIPIDYIAGTSMGAIVAGMYASGMSPEEIEQQFLSLDWWDVLKDRSPNQYLTYRRKIENKRFMGIEFGVKKTNLQFAPGISYGQKLNNILGTFAINSAGIDNFDHLNIPYRAVATDLRSGTSVVIDRGNLATAMRASMAVPGVFTPVFDDDMVLIDGGILNNIPVDAVKSMGADIVIAVDVGASSAEKSKRSDFTALSDVVSGTYFVIQRTQQNEQLAKADLIIAPELSDAAASQFHKAAEIMPRGRLAAMEAGDRLQAFSVDADSYSEYLVHQRKRRADEVYISSVAIKGNSTVHEDIIRRRIKSKEGPFELNTVYDDLNRIHGLGLFQTATYELIPGDDGYVLEYNTDEKFWGPNYLRFGMKLETASDASMLWSVLVNHTRTQLNRLGGELRLELEGGGHIRSLESEWYQPMTQSGIFFLAPSILLSSEDLDLYLDDTIVADVNMSRAFGMLDAGLSAFEFGEFRVGMLGGYAQADGNAGPISLGSEEDAVVAATTRVRFDQLDDPVFPTRGVRISCDGQFAFEDAGSSESFSRVELKTMLPFTIGNHTITPRLAAGSSLGTELPFFALFDLGGMDEFAGYAPNQLLGYYYGIASIGYRYRLGKLPPTVGNGIFALLRADAGNSWIDANEIGFDDLNYGGLAGLSADTLIGTCMIAVGKAEGLNPRFYFSIGNTF